MKRLLDVVLGSACALASFGCADRDLGLEIETAAPGTRLHPIETVAQGARAVDAYWDEELEIECRFAWADDGEMRCLPTAGSIFEDETCERQLWVREGVPDCTEPPPRFVSERIAWECSEEPRYVTFEIIGEVEAPDALYDGDASDCRVAGVGPSRAFEVEPVDPSIFVEADVETARASEGLRVEMLTGEDGSRHVDGLVSSQHDEDCSPVWVDGVGRCAPVGNWIPAQVRDSHHFADRDCTEPLLMTGPEPACSPSWIYDERSQSVRTYGPMFEGDTYYERRGNACVEFSADSWGLHYRLGEVVPPNSMPRLVGEVLGGGTLTSERWSTPSGNLVALSERLVHEPSGSGCELGVDASVVLRCVPETWRASGSNLGYYADGECTEPLEQYGFDPKTPYLVQTSGICGAVRRIEAVFEAGPLWEQASAYRETEEGCRRETLPPELWNLIRVGARVDPSVLPEVQRRVMHSGA